MNKVLSPLLLISIFVFCINCYAEEQFVYDSGGRRNPFIALVTPDGRFVNLDKAKTKGELTVEGIIYDEAGGSYAIVNGSIVKKGDAIDGYQVLNMEKDKVLFLKGEEIIEREIESEDK